jgi:hypothetical protein
MEILDIGEIEMSNQDLKQCRDPDLLQVGL